jgi:hypothetical protein
VERHLLPNEIELILDGEEGFGITQLKAHLRDCAPCRASLDEARAVVEALDHLPHFSPSPQFAPKLMARVQVFEPWHVAALDSARRWLPQSRPLRVVAGVMAASMALAVSLGAVFLATRFDQVLFFGTLAASRGREALVAGLGDTVAALFGDAALDALRTAGPMGMTIGLTAFLVVVAGAALGLRALATASRRRRA